MARFLPALRSKDTGLAPDLQSVAAALGPLSMEQKAIVGAYLGALANYYGQSGWGRRNRRWDVDRAVAEGYERLVWVFKSVDAIAGNCSARKFRLMDGETPVTDHPLIDLLNGPKANPLETGPEFRERLSGQILLSRRGAFVEVVMSRRSTPMRVDLLPPGRTEIIPGDKDEPVKKYKVTLIDGTIRYLEPEQVIWFRKPHPTDPFSSITPLEAAGLPVELDYAADMYNARFMANDGRPGGILSVRNGNSGAPMSDPEMDRIERRFGKGPVEAGKMSVISGDITYVDPAAKPRDTHYADLSDRAKIKILTAFGLDESIVGDTAGKTFANATQAWENFWALDPMPGHIRLVCTGWSRLPGLEDLQPDLDLDDVEPLRRAKAARLEAARAEVAAGLRSIKSYADLAGYGDEIDDTAHTRALWIAAGHTPIPSRTEDEAALGLAAAGPGPSEQVSAPAGANALPGPSGPAAAVEAPAAAAALPPSPRSAADVVQHATAGRTGSDILQQAQGKHLRAVPEIKARMAPRRPRPRLVATPVAPAHSSEPDEEASRAAEDALARALALLADRFVERTVARLQSPKQRKGTRHWKAQYVHDTRFGVKALDTARVVDEDTWAADAQTVAQPYVQAAAAYAADSTTSDMTGPEHPVLDAAVTTAAVAAALALIEQSARRQAQRLSAVLNAADQAGEALEGMVAVVRRWGGRLRAWARGVATQASIAVIEGSRSAAVQALIASGALDPTTVRRTWITMMDEHVRPSHRRAQGQQVKLGVPFSVGAALLRYPGDPLGPPSEVINCRCKTLITVGSVHARVSIGPALTA